MDGSYVDHNGIKLHCIPSLTLPSPPLHSSLESSVILPAIHPLILLNSFRNYAFGDGIIWFYSSNFGLDPGPTQYYMTAILVTWNIKMIYGLIFDNFPLWRRHDKSWMIVAGFISTFGFWGLGFPSLTSDPGSTCFFFFIALMGMAMSDVIADSMVVKRAKVNRDGERWMKFGKKRQSKHHILWYSLALSRLLVNLVALIYSHIAGYYLQWEVLLVDQWLGTLITKMVQAQESKISSFSHKPSQLTTPPCKVYSVHFTHSLPSSLPLHLSFNKNHLHPSNGQALIS